MLASLTGTAQNLNISGIVTDDKSEPVVGATVVVKGTSTGASTGINGDYNIAAPPDATLEFTFLGMTAKTEAVGGRARIDVVMNAGTTALDEVVVIGYGSVRKGDLTTAVATVSTKDLDQRPIVSAGQAIQGKAAGVQVIQPNGAPGGEVSIRVRGTTSFNGSNDPLYVVDGVPVDNINFLAPNDIANIQILKDASSAAIYGSRGANGVVIVTTKASEKGGAKITFNAQLTAKKVSNQIEVLKAEQYKELQKEIGLINVPDNATDKTDWFKETYGTGIAQNYQLSISNGINNLKYYLSGGLTEEKGILSAAFYKRYNFRAGVEDQIFKWLNVSANITYSDYSKNGVATGETGIVLTVLQLPPTLGIMDENDNTLYNHSFYGMNISNSIEELENGKDDQEKENRLIASANALITFLPELTFKSSYTLDRRNHINTGFNPVVHTVDRDDWGYGWDSRNTNTLFVFDNVLNYNKKFAKHGIDLMAGSSWTDSYFTNNYINGDHYRNNDIKVLDAANRIIWYNTGSNAAAWGIMSYFGRVAYNYDSKYLFTANIRADGSSKLAPAHRWANFPSFSAAWRVSSEEFMKGLTWLDDLKIRGGWGQTGNQSGIGDYSYLQHYGISRQPWYEEGKENAVPNISQSNLRTSDLRWETTTQTNVGIDLTVLKNRLTVTMDYYYKRTTDMLMNVSLPAGAAAASSIARNEGEMENKGFEFSVSSKNFTGDFSWNTDFNISFNKNKLVSLELQQIYTDVWTGNMLLEQVVRNEPGRPLGGFYGYISEGVDPETGNLIYRDIDPNGKITATDRAYIGDPNPDFTFGMTNTLSYKNFNLSIFLQGSYGNDVYNASRIETEGMFNGSNQSTRVLGRWQVPGQVTDIPKANFNIKHSSYFVEDGSYLRVKDISISYNIKAAFLTKIGISRLQPYFTASNLLTWTKYSGMDPEVNHYGNSGAVQGIDWGTYPHSRSFVLGVNVEF